MESELKNKPVIILAVLTMIFFISSVKSCQNVARQKKIANQVRLQRMELEEKVLSLSDANLELGQKISQLQGSFKKQKATHQAVQQALNKAISELKEELETVSVLNMKLEKDLDEAIISSGGDK